MQYPDKEEQEMRMQISELVSMNRGDGDGPEDVGDIFEGDSDEDD